MTHSLAATIRRPPAIADSSTCARPGWTTSSPTRARPSLLQAACPLHRPPLSECHSACLRMPLSNTPMSHLVSHRASGSAVAQARQAVSTKSCLYPWLSWVFRVSGTPTCVVLMPSIGCGIPSTRCRRFEPPRPRLRALNDLSRGRQRRADRRFLCSTCERSRVSKAIPSTLWRLCQCKASTASLPKW